MTTYQATSAIPALVRQATALAAELGFVSSCTPEVGRLLRVLAGACTRGRIGEIGTGCGVGTAWMAGALAPGVELWTVEIDARRAALARCLLRAVPGVQVLTGNWQTILPHGPFALLFADARAAKVETPESVVAALAPGGLLVLDDLTPEDQWPPEWLGRADRVRAWWLNESRLAATEIRVTPSAAVILATRVG
jgi:predicted O-methyltransferase YrrM